MAYNQTMGAAYNYGNQNQIPGKASGPQDPNQSAQPNYMNYQMQQFGRPQRQPQQATSQGQTAVMPNGVPTPPQQQPQAPQQPRNNYYGQQLQGLPPQGQAAQPAAAPAPAPAQPPGAPGPGWVNVNGGWYPPDHPVAQNYVQQQQQQTANTQSAANGMGNAGYTDAQGVYHAGSAPGVTYQAQNVQQFQQPQQLNPVNNQVLSNISSLLNSGGSMNPQVVAQMKGADKDQAALQAQQQIGAQQQALASSGRDLSSGQAQLLQRAIQNQSDQNVLGNNRAIDVNAATTNRSDLLNALSAAGQGTNNIMGQATQGYNANLQGLSANQGEQLAQLASIYQPFNTNTALLQNQAATQQGAIGQQLQGQSLADQMAQFNAQNNLANRQFAESQSEFGQNFGLQQQQLNQANNQYYDGLSMQYALSPQNPTNQQNTLYSYLMNSNGSGS